MADAVTPPPVDVAALETAIADPAKGNGAAPPAETATEIDKLDESLRGKRVRVPVGGELREMSIEEALKSAQRGLGADRKFEEAAKHRRAADRFLEDPDAYVKRFGPAGVKRVIANAWRGGDATLKGALEEALTDLAAEASLPPEEVERKRKVDADDARARDLDAKERAWQERERAAAAQKALAPLHASYTAALKAAGLPASGDASRYALARMASIASADLDERRYHGIREYGIDIFARDADQKLRRLHPDSVQELLRDPTPEQIAQLVAREYEAERGAWAGDVSKLDGEELLGAVGEATARKIAAAFVARLKRAQKAAPSSGSGGESVKAPPRRLSTDELRDKWAAERGGRR